MDKEIDYARVSNILNREIAQSRKWLSDSLQEVRHWKGSYDTYDYCLNIMQELEWQKADNAIRNCKIRHEIFMDRLAKSRKNEGNINFGKGSR